MLKSLKIRYKILLYPILFTIIILLVFIVTQQSNNWSKVQLNNIQEGYVPYLEIANKLHYELLSLQREFQDAVAASDEEMLDATKLKFEQISAMLDTASLNIIGRDNEKVPLLKVKLDNYYNLAFNTSLSMIKGDFTDALSNDINLMIEEFNAIKENLNTLISESKQANNNAFSSTLEALKSSFRYVILILLVSLIVFLLISYQISVPLNRSIAIIKSKLTALADGKILIEEGKAKKFSKDEMGEMSESVFEVQKGLEKTSAFAEEIGKGNLDASFTPLSSEDKLGNALLEMKDNLIKAKVEQEKMVAEEEKNKWTANGLAKFGDIIRINDDGLESLAFDIVKNLVDFLKINMGAIYVREEQDDEVIYKIKSAIAYDRAKIIDSGFKIGEGLVGRCVFEKLSIYLTDIPQDYLNITSGLGDANPNCLLIVPLITDDKVFGALELASFNNFEPHEIAFVEKLGESIASTLLTVQNNQQTIKLLEQSKLQGEELASQEEEMRQNMEELQATQEEAARRQQEMEGVINAINSSLFKVEYNAAGNILDANDKYISFINKGSEALLNKSFKEEYALLSANYDEINSIWPEIVAGNAKKAMVSVLIDGKQYNIEENFTPVFLNNESQVSRIIKVSYVV